MIIDKYLSDYHFSERHTIKINASKEEIFNAIVELTPDEISFLFRFLFFLRSIPPRILGRKYIGFDSHSSLLKQMEEKGFKIFERDENELVFGVIGNLEKLKKGEVPEIDDFINYTGGQSVKVVANFHLEEDKNEIELSTETRIFVCDKKTKRKFTLYWAVVYPGSALIRRIWLKAIKRRVTNQLSN